MRSRAAAAVTLAVLLVAGVAAQETFVTLVEVHFVVTDHDGRFVRNLRAADVAVYDNDRRQEISSFSQHVQAPLSVAMIIDRSASVRDRFPLILDAASDFVRTVVHAPDDRGALVAFDSKVYLLQPWTSDAGLLVDQLHRLTTNGGSSMFDALYKTCRDAFDPMDTRQKVAVLVTDGEDTTSVATFDEALQMAKMARVAVYVLGVRAEGSLNTRETQGRRVLTNLVALTGGRAFYPADFSGSALSDTFATLQGELRNGYSVTYYLDVPPDNSFHRVRIEPADHTLRVQAPSGYYAHKGRAGR